MLGTCGHSNAPDLFIQARSTQLLIYRIANISDGKFTAALHREMYSPSDLMRTDFLKCIIGGFNALEIYCVS